MQSKYCVVEKQQIIQTFLLIPLFHWFVFCHLTFVPLYLKPAIIRNHTMQYSCVSILLPVNWYTLGQLV
jgi:hypothetical protein